MAEAQEIPDKIDMQRVGELTEQFLATFVKGIGAQDNPIAQNIMDGLTGAQAIGLTRDDLDVIYAASFRRLNARDWAAAIDAFMYLVLIDPLHAPNHYCLGVAFQGAGRMAEAENSFLHFLALDATNPVGYLRLGECYLHRGDKSLGREAFELAEAECRNGHGDSETLAQARTKLSLINDEVRG